MSEERITTLECVLATNNTLLQKAKDGFFMICVRLDISKLQQLPETHILQSKLLLT